MANQPTPTNLNQATIRHQPTSITFGVYTDDEVRQRSVTEITSSVAFDALNNALPRGLYDPFLGPTDSKGGVLVYNFVDCMSCVVISNS